MTEDYDYVACVKYDAQMAGDSWCWYVLTRYQYETLGKRLPSDAIASWRGRAPSRRAARVKARRFAKRMRDRNRLRRAHPGVYTEFR